MKIPFLLFGGIARDRFGGWEDFLGYADSVDEAKQRAEEMKLGLVSDRWSRARRPRHDDSAKQAREERAMTDATQKDLEQDRALKKMRDEFQAEIEKLRSLRDSGTVVVMLAAILKSVDDRLMAVEDQLVAEGRIRAKDLLP